MERAEKMDLISTKIWRECNSNYISVLQRGGLPRS